MKYLLKLNLLAFFLISFSEVAITQNTAERSDRDTDFSGKFWYGGGLGLGLTGSTFKIGLSPMIGYKITQRFSTGVRIPLEYTHFKLGNPDGNALSFSNLDFGIGAFSRYKIFQNIFSHAEYQHLWLEQPVTSGGSLLLDPSDSHSILSEKLGENQVNLGLGYTSGRGNLGYEISLLYNVLEGPNSLQTPWQGKNGFELQILRTECSSKIGADIEITTDISVHETGHRMNQYSEAIRST